MHELIDREATLKKMCETCGYCELLRKMDISYEIRSDENGREVSWHPGDGLANDGA